MRAIANTMVAAVAAFVTMLAATRAPAEQLQLGAAPTNPGKAGFTMFVYAHRLGNEGFRPIKLEFRPIGPSFNRQRQLQIRFRPRNQYTTELDFQFTVRVTVPQGATKHEETVLVPSFYRWESCRVDVVEDGRRLGRLPSVFGMMPAVQDWGQRMSIGILIPRDATKQQAPWARFPDLRSIITVLGDGPISDTSETARLNDQQARDLVEKTQSGYARFRIFDEDELQSSWVGYTQLDLILAPYPVLKRIEEEQPDKLSQLRRWVSAGGQLWTYAAPLTNSALPTNGASQSSGRPTSWLFGEAAETAREIRYNGNPSSALKLNEINDTSPIQYQPWNFGSFTSGAFMAGNSQPSRREVYDKLVAAKHPVVQTMTRKQLAAGLGVMHYGMGRVVLIGQPDPFPGSFQFWQALQTSGQDWNTRQGVNFAGGNDSYWAWLMGTVGQPPVTLFVILNGLFVLVMGPILYFTLRRRSRLYLLYFLAPALALGVTLGLFAFAFLSDGFQNRARIRQLTWVDGRHPIQNGDAADELRFPVVDQSRQTYYTVIDNQQGLRFDDDTFALPVLHPELRNNYNYTMGDTSRPGDYLIQRQGTQRVYSGDFLPTRTQVHYLATRPSLGNCPLEFQRSDGIATVTNRLPSRLARVAIRDADGKYWTARDIDPGATVQLSAARSAVFTELTEQVVDPDTSEMPTPFQNRVSLNDRTGMEEKFLGFARQPPNASFLGTTEVTPEQFALRDCAPEDCIRLIGGRLP